jgi:hypothetical protein
VKYLGIGRGIPLSNTNQLWGLAWGALVFGELAHASSLQRLLVISGSAVMIIGAISISSAIAGQRENSSIHESLRKECERYKLDYERVVAEYIGKDFGAQEGRRWWDYLIVAAAVGVFVWLASRAAVPPIAMNHYWLAVLGTILVISLVACTRALWKTTKLS